MTMRAIFNKNIISTSLPIIYFNDRGFLFGDGLFETIKAEKGNLLFFSKHYNRLAKSAKKLCIHFSISLLELKTQCKKLLEINKLSEAIVRITLTRGNTKSGLDIPPQTSANLLITTFPYTRQSDIYPTVCITDIKRNEYSLLSRLKTLNFLEPILARQQATKNGYIEGIMLNTKGAVTETSVGNLFVIINQTIYTPKEKDGLLPGVIRQIIIDIILEVGIPFREKTLYPKDLIEASEIFHTNSLIEMQSFSKINEYSLATGNKALWTQKILKHYQRYKINTNSN